MRFRFPSTRNIGRSLNAKLNDRSGTHAPPGDDCSKRHGRSGHIPFPLRLTSLNAVNHPASLQQTVPGRRTRLTTPSPSRCGCERATSCVCRDRSTCQLIGFEFVVFRKECGPLLLAFALGIALHQASVAADRETHISFINHVLPVLTEIGCNRGVCHAAKAGKGGSRLSLRGADPASDYRAMVREWAGRQIESIRPKQSLLL